MLGGTTEPPTEEGVPPVLGRRVSEGLRSSTAVQAGYVGSGCMAAQYGLRCGPDGMTETPAEEKELPLPEPPFLEWQPGRPETGAAFTGMRTSGTGFAFVGSALRVAARVENAGDVRSVSLGATTSV